MTGKVRSKIDSGPTATCGICATLKVAFVCMSESARDGKAVWMDGWDEGRGSSGRGDLLMGGRGCGARAGLVVEEHDVAWLYHWGMLQMYSGTYGPLKTTRQAFSSLDDNTCGWRVVEGAGFEWSGVSSASAPALGVDGGVFVFGGVSPCDGDGMPWPRRRVRGGKVRPRCACWSWEERGGVGSWGWMVGGEVEKGGWAMWDGSLGF